MTSYDPDYFPRYTVSPQKAPKRRLSPEELERTKRFFEGLDLPDPGLLFPDRTPPTGIPRPDIKGGHRPDVSPRTPQGPGISGSPRSPQGPIGPGGPRDPWPSEAQWQQGTRSLIDAIKELNKFNAP